MMPAKLAPTIESTFEVLADPNVPEYRKRAALVALAEAAYLTGRGDQVERDLDALRSMAGRS